MAGLSKLTDSLIKSDDSGVQGVADDDCFMGDAVEGDAMNEHRLLVLVRKFNGDRWVTAGVVPRSPEEYAVKTTTKDLQISVQLRWNAMKSLMQSAVQTLRETVGPVDVIFEESGVAESQQNASVERAIWEFQSTARSVVFACQERQRVKLVLPHTH